MPGFLKNHAIIIFWLYLLSILLLVTLPLNSAGALNNITILQLRGDYFFHILMFLPWMFFAKAVGIKPWIWLFMGVLFASATEGLQYLLPYRAYNINDLASNALGVLMSVGLVGLYTALAKTRNSTKY